MNGFGLEGARALEGALKENKYLTDLNISYCRIPDEASVYIAGGLQHNDTLEKLNVSLFTRDFQKIKITGCFTYIKICINL